MYLFFLSSREIVHGDVKLENVLLLEAGNLNSVKLSGIRINVYTILGQTTLNDSFASHGSNCRFWNVTSLRVTI